MAEERGPSCDRVGRETVVACVLARSPQLRVELAGQRAAKGRREAARPVLPSNPVLGGSLSNRSSPTETGLNWSVNLGQELEVAGQSWLRVAVADANLRAEEQHLLAAKQSLAAQAWNAWFRHLAAAERLKLSTRLELATREVATTVRGMASSGLGAEVDAEVAEAAALRASQDRAVHEGQAVASTARLRLLAGGLPTTTLATLEPLATAQGAQSSQTRPELRAFDALRTGLEKRVDLLHREAIPNPTLSFFAQSDGFSERVFGGGLSLPIPLPQPLGRTQRGEVEEARALVDKLEAEKEQQQLVLELELLSARAEFDAAAKARALYSKERIDRVNVRLEAITQQVKAGRLAVRDALVSQQALVDQLKADIEAREALCAASVRLVRAAGLSLEGDSL
jgi:outer membrane protein, heavy metal efflux system